MNQELLRAAALAKMRKVGGPRSANRNEHQTKQSRSAATDDVRERDYFDAPGSPVGGGAWSEAEGGPSNSVRTGFNASAHT